jgi:hypothetical protein
LGYLFATKRKALQEQRVLTDWRSGAFCRTVGLAYDPKSWLLELDNKKSGSGRLILPAGAGLIHFQL